VSDISSENRSFGSFAFEGLKIGVSCSEAQDLIWLREFLSPQFRGFRRGPPDCVVRLTYDAAKHASLLSAGPHPSNRELDCFNLDRKTVRLPLWRSRDRGLVIFDHEFNVFYGIARRGKDISITAAARNLWSGRISLMRVVRELGMNHAIDRGAMILHGAAFQLNGKGILVAGPKGAGKTSLLTYFLQKKAARYVSNDRVLVDLARRQPLLRGIPTIITLRKTMLEMFPVLLRHLRRSCFNPCLRLQEAQNALLGPAAIDEEGRFHLSPGQLCELTGVGVVGGGALSLLIFPLVSAADTCVSMERMSAESAAQRMQAALFHSSVPSRKSTFFNARASKSQAVRKSHIHLTLEMASRVPCFECRLGRRAFRGDVLLRDLLTVLELKEKR
jgi:hypothetical protein